MSSPATLTNPGPGGGVKRILAVVHCAPPWHCWQFADVNNARPATTSGSVLFTGEIGERMPNCMNALIASQPPMPRTSSWLRPPLASGTKLLTFGSCVIPSASTIMPRPPDTARMLSSKSSSSSRSADQLSGRMMLRFATVWSKSVC